jgi:drug/metabolite transporter (DMT)-like permease
MTNPPSAAYGASPVRTAYIILTLTTLFWGGNVVAGKLAVGHIEPNALMILRWTGALLAVLPFAMGPLKRDWPMIRGKWWLYFFYGAVGFATFNVLVYVAAHFTSGVNTAIEQVAVNIFVMMLNFALFRTKVRGLQILGVILTIIGVALTATHGDLGRILALEVNAGDVMVIAACFAYAIYSIGLRWKPATHWMSFFVPTVVAAIIASFFYQGVIGGGVGAFFTQLPQITTEGWMIVAYTVLFPSVISQILYVRGVELIGSNRASLFVNLIPIFGTIGSVLVLGERLESFHLAAAGLVVIGIVLAEWSVRRGANKTGGSEAARDAAPLP